MSHDIFIEYLICTLFVLGFASATAAIALWIYRNIKPTNQNDKQSNGQV